MTKSTKSRLAAAAAAVFCIAGASIPAYAAVRTWDGGGADDNFMTAANWVDDLAIPAAGLTGQADDIHFAGAVRLTPVNNATTCDIRNLFFDADAGAFTVSGGTITVGRATTSTITDTIANNSAFTQTISSNVKTRKLIIAANTADLVFNGTELNLGNSPDNGNRPLTVTGSKDIYFNFTNIVGGAASFPHALTKTGTGTLFINNTGNNTRYGANNIADGAIRISNGNALGQTAQGTNIQGGNNTAVAGRLELVNSISVPESFSINARQGAGVDVPHFVSVSGNNTITGNVTGGTGGSDYNFVSNAGATLTFNGNFATPGSGDRRVKFMGDGDGTWAGQLNATSQRLYVVKRGAGTWTLSGTNNWNFTDAADTIAPEAIFNIEAGRLLMTGSTTSNGAVTVAAGTLELADAGSITAPAVNIQTGTTLLAKGTTTLSTDRITVNAGGTLDVSDFGAGYTLAYGKTLAGAGTVLGRINVDAAKIVPGDGGSGALTLSSLAVTGYGGSMDFTLGQKQSSINVTAADGFTADGSTSINIGGVGLTVGQFTLIDYAGSLGGPGGYGSFVKGTLPPRVTADLVLNSANGSIDLNVTQVDKPTWTGMAAGVPNGTWDTYTSNWQEVVSGNVTTYLQPSIPGDEVLFDDTATGTKDVDIATTVSPARITVDTAGTYRFQSWGNISGPGDLIKRGEGTLVVANSGLNDYTGGTVIEAGTIQVGDADINYGMSGNLPGTVSIAEAGKVVFARLDDSDAPTVFAGAGAIEKTSPAILTLTGNSPAFEGNILVSEGTLKAGHNAALGSAVGSTTILSGASLDTNNKNLGLEPIFVEGAGVNGNGAIVNTAGEQQQSLRVVTLTGDTTFGGTGRWDIREPDTTGAGPGKLDAQGHNLTKIGANFVGLIRLGETNLADVNINEGTLSFSYSTTMGDPTKTITVGATATLELWRGGQPYDKKLVINGGKLFAGGEDAAVPLRSFVGPITLNGDSTIDVAANVTLQAAGAIDGYGRLTKAGTGTLILGDNNTYTGATHISGVLQASKLASGGQPSSIGASGSGAESLVLNAGTLRYTGEGAEIDRLFTLGTGTSRISSSGEGALKFTSTMPITIGYADTNANRILRLEGTNTGDNTLAVSIPDDGDEAFTVALHKFGAGTWIVSGDNSYDGVNSFEEGTIVITSDNALGSTVGHTGINDQTPSATYPIPVSMQLSSDSGLNIAENFRTSGGGSGGGSPEGVGLIRNVKGNNTLSGTITLVSGGGDTTITSDAGLLNLSGIVTNDPGYDRVLWIGGAGNGVISGVVQNNTAKTMGIGKTGTGTWTLSGANTYTGATTVRRGTLAIDSTGSIAGSSRITVAAEGTLDVTAFGPAGWTVATNQELTGVGAIAGTVATTTGATITPGTAGTAGTLTMGGLNLAGGSLNFDLGAIAASDFIQLNDGALAIAPGSVTTFNLNDIGLEVGTYKLIDFGSISGQLTDLLLNPDILGGLPVRLEIDAVNTSLNLVVTPGDDLTQWIVAGGGNASDPANWRNAEVPNAIGAVARFWGQGSGSVTVDAPFTVGTLSIDNPVAYSIGGAQPITLQAAGTAKATLKVASGAHAISAPLVLASDTTVNIQAADASLIASGIISGDKGITKLGLGSVTLSADNTYTGATTVAGGTLIATSLKNGGVASSIGQSSSAAGNLVLNGGTLRYAGAGDTTDRLFTLGASALAGVLQSSGTGAVAFTNAGPIAFTGAGDRTLTLGGTNTGDNLLAAAIGEPAETVTSIVKTDAGTWALAGDNTYSGTTRISGGTLVAASAKALGSVAGNTIVNGGTLGVRGGVSIAEAVAIAGTASNVGLANLADENTWTGPVSLVEGSGDAYRLQADAGTLTITSDVVNDTATTVTAARTLRLQGSAGTGILAGAIRNGTGNQVVNIAKFGAGTWVLSGNNTFDGTANLEEGVVVLTSDTALGSTVGNTSITDQTAGDGYPIPISVQLSSDTGLNIAENFRTSGGGGGGYNPDGVGIIRSVKGNNTLSGVITLMSGGGDTTITVDEGSHLTLSGTMTNDADLSRVLWLGGAGTGDVTGIVQNSNAGRMGIGKAGTGTWTLSAFNTYTGATTVRAGTLRLGQNAGLATSAIQVDAGATFDVSPTLQWTTTWYVPASAALSGSGTFKGGYYLQSTNTLTPGSAGTAGTLTFEGPAEIFSAAINFDLGPTADPAASDLIQVNGNLTLSGIPVNLNLPGGVPAPGSYPMFKYTGTLNGDSYSLAVAGSENFRQTFAFDTTSTPNQINIVVSGSNATLNWTGSTNGNWDIRGAYNWNNTSTGFGDVFYTYDNVVFGDSGALAPNVSLTTAIAAGIVTVQGAQDYAFAGSGKLTSGTSIVKTGTGTLTINNANDFTGTVTISEGVLKAGNAAALGSTAGATTINGTGTLDTNNKNLGQEPIFVEGAGVNGAGAIINTGAEQQTTLRIVTLTGDTTLGGTGRWDIRESDTTGAGPGKLDAQGFNLTKVGSNFIGLIRLGETNLGDININEGTVSFEYSTTMGDPTKSVTVAAGATLQTWKSGLEYNKNLVLNGGRFFASGEDATVPLRYFAGPVTLNADSTVEAATNVTLKVTGAIGGTGGLIKAGAGTVIVGDANTYAGTTRISAGVLEAASLPNGGEISSIGVSSSDAANLVLAGGQLRYVGDGDQTDRLFTLANGTSRIVANGTGALEFTNAGPIGYTGTGTRALRLDGTSTALNLMPATIGDEPGGAATTLQKYGAGTWVLSGNNTHSGQTLVEQGILIVTSEGALGNTTGNTRVRDNSLGDDATPASLQLVSDTGLTLNENFVTTGGGAGGYDQPNSPGVIRSVKGDNVLTGTFTLESGGGGSIYKVDAGSTLTFSGVIQPESGSGRSLRLGGEGEGFVTGVLKNNGSRVLTVEKIDAGTWTLSGANTYTGATTVTQGKLVLKEAQNLRAFNVAAGAEAEIAPDSSLSVTALNLAGDEVAGWTGLVDLTTGSLSVANADDAVLARITSQILQARNGGAWDGAAGITSSADMLGGLMNVGVILEGTTVRAGYVRTGDLNVDGVIDGEDYLLADSGFMAGRTRWQDGNVDYGLVVDGDDFFAIDQGFLSQSAPLAPQGVAAVPEPGTLSLLAIGVAGLLARRRRA